MDKKVPGFTFQRRGHPDIFRYQNFHYTETKIHLVNFRGVHACHHFCSFIDLIDLFFHVPSHWSMLAASISVLRPANCQLDSVSVNMTFSGSSTLDICIFPLIKSILYKVYTSKNEFQKAIDIFDQWYTCFSLQLFIFTLRFVSFSDKQI